MQNNRLRVYDIANDELRPAISHESLHKPHGVWPNPSQTRIAIPNYQFDAYSVSMWTYDGNGNLTFDREVTLSDGTLHGAYHHSITWLDDNRFLVDSTQELTQGTPNTAMASVWLVDLNVNTTTPILREVTAENASSGVLEGVSYNLIANNKLYICEGNVEEMGESPAHVSIWDISTPTSPTLIRRLSAGSGLPNTFVECHELAMTPDGRYVFAQSFASDSLVQIDTSNDAVIYSWDRETVRVPHGIYVR